LLHILFTGKDSIIPGCTFENEEESGIFVAR
jgi:hypothetical protein